MPIHQADAHQPRTIAQVDDSDAPAVDPTYPLASLTTAEALVRGSSELEPRARPEAHLEANLNLKFRINHGRL